MKKTVYQFRNLDDETIKKLNEIKTVYRAKNLAQVLKKLVDDFYNENNVKKELEKINAFFNAS